MNSNELRLSNRINKNKQEIESNGIDIATLFTNIGGGAGSPIACGVTRTSTQSILNATTTNVSWNSESYDTDDMFELTSPTVITVKTSGRYDVYATIQIDNHTGIIVVSIKKNSTVIGKSAELGSSSYYTYADAFAKGISLQAGDTLSVTVYQNSGSAVNISPESGASRFEVTATLGEKGDTGATGATGAQGIQGIQGEQGVQGEQGIQGETGEGVPSGGTAGQILEKIDGTDYNAAWVDNTAAKTSIADTGNKITATDVEGALQENRTAIDLNTAKNSYPSADANKLAGIEASADITDAANVSAAGAVMNTGDETIAGVKTFSSLLKIPTTTPTQEAEAASKKYVDDTVAAAGGYTDENAQDAVGTMIVDTDTIDLTYTDAANELKADVKKQMSITSDSSGVKLSGDEASPGNSHYYGTNNSGTKGYHKIMQSVCRVSRTTTQSIPNTTSTSVSWNNEITDTDSMFTSGSPTVITCKTAGYYDINAMVQWSNNGTGIRLMLIKKNSATIAKIVDPGNATYYTYTPLTALGVQLAVNDTISVEVYQTSGGALNIEPETTGYTRLEVKSAIAV